MKRFHVHVAVDNLKQSIDFYSRLFAAPPAVERVDYAKWMLDDPRVNFAISARGHAPGVNHLGIQAGSAEELAELGRRAQGIAGGAVTGNFLPGEKSRVQRGRRKLKALLLECCHVEVARNGNIVDYAAKPGCCPPSS